MKIVLFLLLASFMSGCWGENKKESNLKEYSRFEPSEEDIVEKLHEKRDIHSYFENRSKLASKLAKQAKDISYQHYYSQGNTDRSITAFEACRDIDGTPAREYNCARAGNIPEAAAKKLITAIEKYDEMLALFNDRVKITSNREVEVEDLVERRCSGFISNLPARLMCEEVVLIKDLYEKSESYFDTYTQTRRSSDFKKFKTYLSFANNMQFQLDLLYKEMRNKRSSLTQGFFSQYEKEDIPYLSILGTPRQHRVNLENLFDKYQSHLERLYNTKLEELRLKKTSFERDKMQIAVEKELLDLETSIKVIGFDTDIAKQEEEQFKKQIDGITKLITNSQQQFSTEFKSVMGNIDEIHNWKTLKKQISPSGDYPEIDLYDSNGVFEGVLNIMGGNGKFRANNIYADTAPGEYFHSFVENKAKEAITNISIKRASASHQSPSWQAEVSPYVDLTNSEDSETTTSDSFLRFTEDEDRLQELQERMHLAGSGLSLEELIQNAEQSGERLRLPKNSQNVSGMVTDLNGYILSTSSSKGASYGSSTSNGRSLSAGVSISNEDRSSDSLSSSISKGHSSSASFNKSSGISYLTGFYSDHARYSLLRVGMMVAEIFCNDQLIASYPIGVSNYLSLNANSYGGCETPKLRFIINDRLLENPTCSWHDSGRCSSRDKIPLEITMFKNVKATYRNVLKIIKSKDFEDIVNDAQYSNDPYGTAWRMVGQKINEAGLPVRELTSQIKGLVDHYVSVKLNEKKLRLIVLNRNENLIKVKKYDAQAVFHRRRLELVSNMNLNNRSLEDLDKIHSSLVDDKQGMEEALASYYLEKMGYWFEIYKKSVKYHEGRDVEDLSELLQENLVALLDEEYSKGSHSDCRMVEGVRRCATDPSISGLIDNFKGMMKTRIFLDDEQQLALVKNLIEQQVVRHCLIDFNDVALLHGLEPSETGSSFEVPLTRFFNEENNSRYMIDDSNPLFMADNTIGGRFGSDFYYSIPFRTDTMFSKQGYAKPSARYNQVGATAPLKCKTIQNIDSGKILGLAFSYQLSNDVVDIGDFYLKRSESMWSVSVEGRKAERNYFSIDYRGLDEMWGFRQPDPIVYTRATNESNLGDICFTEANARLWDTTKCMKSLISSNILDERIPVEANFFQRLLSGDWQLLVSGEMEYDQFLKALSSLKLHIYYTSTHFVN